MSRIQIFDIEGDGLTPTKIYCLCVSGEKLNIRSTSSYEKMKEFFLNADILVGHNIIRWDIPQIERLLNIKIKAKLVDTLALSWYLEPDRLKHGLEEWGEEFGIPKPKIDNWIDLELKEYIHRCSEDVKINTNLWNRFWKHLMLLYKDEEQVWKFIDYLMFKMDCAREQERSRWKLDEQRAIDAVARLTEQKVKKTEELKLAMPKVKKIARKSRPAKPYKKDGSYSTTGARWFALLRKHNLPEDYEGELEVVIGEDDPNPNSSIQIKEWLYSLGWKPITFKYLRDKDTGDVRKIPQINKEHGGGLCDSVLALVANNPSVSLLDSLGVISHRISILNGFLSNVDDSFIMARIQGITNTLRFKHAVAVNLPKTNKPYAEDIRACLIAPEGYELCGSDMASLEDRLKQHYIYPFDPDYVNEMNVPDFDPHLSLALLANAVTLDQVNRYKEGTDKSIKPIRDIFKNGNYACQYGAGPPRLALTANISEKEAKKVYDAYWKKNWAVRKVAEVQRVKTVRDQMWLLNPINGFWYSLRYEKDIFSTLVQGSASYVFDLWVMRFRTKRPQLTAQFHDEVVLCVKKGNREKAISLLQNAIKEVNEELKLNRQLDVDVQFGDRYSEIH